LVNLHLEPDLVNAILTLRITGWPRGYQSELMRLFAQNQGQINMSTFQRLAQLRPQVFHRKRFLDEIYPFIQHTLVGDDISGIAGHEQPFELRGAVKEVVGQIPAVHLRHDHVGDQQVDPAPKSLKS